MMTLDLESFGYDDGPALSNLTLTISPGEHVLVVGASGSGKSSLARLAAGHYDAGQGERLVGSLSLNGERLVFCGDSSDPSIDPGAWGARVGYVGQNAHAQLSMVCATVAEEIAFGLANRGVPVDEMHRRVERTAARIGLADLLDRDPRRLSGGELQRVCLAAVVVGSPVLLVLDEPFKGLDASGRKGIGELFAELRRGGTAVLQFEPVLPPDWRCLERIVGLADGDAVFDGAGADLCGAELEAYGIGSEALQRAPSRRLNPPTGQDPAIQVDDVVSGYGGDAVLTIAGLEVPRGHAVALMGANGSGKSTLLQHLNGLLQPSAGDVRINGRTIRGTPPGQLAATVGYLFQDTDRQLFETTALREVAYGPRAAGHSREEAKRRAREALDAVGLGSEVLTHPHELGYRQRRLLALASIMASGPAIWLLDEPTAGLDLRGREVLARLTLEHRSGGGTLLMATHDAGFAEAVCDWGILLEEGRVMSRWAY